MKPSVQSTVGIPGLLKLGTVIEYSAEDYTVKVQLTPSPNTPTTIVKAQLPAGFYSVDKLFIGGKPNPGTPVLLGQSEGGAYYILTTIVNNYTSANGSLDLIKELDDDSLSLQAGDDNEIKLNINNGIIIGNNNNWTQYAPKNEIIIGNYHNSYNFTEAGRSITGIIKRDLKPNVNIPSALRLNGLEYDSTLKTISMDPKMGPSAINSGNSTKNPPLVESRSTTYEFAYSYNIQNDLVELQNYKTGQQKYSSILSRRSGRTDILGLSLVQPNYLIESVSGTVVDIYGNILDINRSLIPIGQTDQLSAKNIKTTVDNSTGNVYKNIRQQQRNSVAFHWELNARKNTDGPPNPNTTENWARDRSRLLFDVNKEGLFKLNIPSTSELGSVPLLTRYENFSTVYPNEISKNPDDLVFNSDNTDIVIDTFAKDGGVIKIVSDDLDGYASPKDRLTDKYIGHGMAYHDVTRTCYSIQNGGLYINEYIPTTNFATDNVPTITDIVSKQIKIGTDSGGRSGSANFDGSIDVSIGANTVDRQSLWINSEGGIILDSGRDKNDVSMALNLDGDLFIEVGGATVNDDTRFTDLDNGHRAGAVDIRVYNSNKNVVSAFRIDKNGVNISTPGKIAISANQGIAIRSAGVIDIEADNLYLNNRLVRKTGGAI